MKEKHTPRSSLTGLLFVFCLAGLVAGVGFDLGAGARERFWIGGEAGVAAAIGALAALSAVIVARLAQALFGRKGGGDAGSHS